MKGSEVDRNVESEIGKYRQKSQRGSNQTEIRRTKMSMSIRSQQNKLCMRNNFYWSKQLTYILF